LGLSLSLAVLAACGNQGFPYGIQPLLSGTSANVRTPLPVGLASPTIPAVPQPTIPTLTATPALTLSPTPSPAPQLPQRLLHFTTIHMLSLSQGWAAGTIIAPGEEVPVQPSIGDIYRTTDGGAQWEKASPDKVSPESFSAIYFLDPQNAWVAANPAGTSSTDASPTSLLVYHTSNGGRTWQTSSLISIPDGSPKSITFTNPSQGWLLVSLGESVNQEAVEILGTSDGGLHWNTVSLTGELPSQSTGGSLPFACIKNGMSFLDKNTGWMAGDCPVGIPFLYMTQDGGKTWQAQTLPAPAALPANVFINCQCDVSPPKFISPQDGYLTVQMNIPNTEAYLYVTNDGGSIWLPFKLPVSQPQGDPLFVDSQHGWITDGSQLYATQDGGQSWTFISQLPAMNLIGSLDFVDMEDGWLTDGSQIFVTHDGGQNWVTIAPSVASLPLPTSLERINFPAGILSYTFRTNLTQDIPQGYTLGLLTGQKMYVAKNGDATIEVVDPQNNLLTDASSQPGPWSVSVAQTGNYTLVLSGQGLVSVTITLSPISGDQTFPLPKGNALQSIVIPQGVLFYQFSATLNQGVPLGYIIHLLSGQKMSLSGTGEMTVAILDPGASLLEPDSSQVNYWQITASQSGVYTIILMGRGASFITVNLTSP
jgi:photosystem II stability/assembly factor-like uncharacterized protein